MEKKVPKKTKKHKKEDTLEEDLLDLRETEEEPLLLDDRQIVIVNNLDIPLGPQDRYRTVMACGDITEASSIQIMNSLFYYGDASSYTLGDQDSVDDPPPIQMKISTCGGSALEMFGIYDVMRGIRDLVNIETHGIGKVMSAGVLLLAAGTKGKRKIGRNCRVMIHGMMGGYHGNITNMENEIQEVKWIQERYVESLVEESFLTEKKIKSMLNRQVDIYLSAEQAVKYGIADIVI